MENRQLFGILGSLILFVGVFAPIVSVPILGSINYFQNGKGDGSLILVLAIISFVLTLTRNYRGLWFTSGATLLVMLITFVNFHSKMDELKTELGSGSGNGLFQGLADMAVQSIQLQWGWALLLAGLALLVTAAAMGGAGFIHQTTRSPTRSLNISSINWMPVLVGLGVLVILFLLGVLWNMQGSSSPGAPENTTAQTDQTIQQLQQQNSMQDTQQRVAEAAQPASIPIDPSALNIQPNQANNQQPVSEATAREELVAFFQKYYAALETNDVPTLERLWNMSAPQATKSINIVKNRASKGIRGRGCSINTAQIRSFTPSPTQATLYIDATCDVDGVKTERFHSSFDLEKSFLGEWQLLKQTSEK
ncbi:MAG: hypothetical protein KJ914_14435 [Gammaproteobacteria bacterium]|nr:hypothetical protein [Gammaproteobacteria bacterium]MBU1724984.1 hypothetical protein [Gammaproteobacteria bacterium]MBU2007094.1 hypothetical protein [Gammaproteobacteria bacterium]